MQSFDVIGREKGIDYSVPPEITSSWRRVRQITAVIDGPLNGSHRNDISIRRGHQNHETLQNQDCFQNNSSDRDGAQHTPSLLR